MTENIELQKDALLLVQAGAWTRDEVIEQLTEQQEGDAGVVDAVDTAIARHQAEQAGWPEVTDVDRLKKAFAALEAQGFIALMHAGTTQSDGYDDVQEIFAERGQPDDVQGYVFFHAQDVERAIRGGGLDLAFGPVVSAKEQEDGPRLGAMIKDALQAQGFQVEWDGSFNQRPRINPFTWQARGPIDMPWIAAYPEGVPGTIDPERYGSIVAVFERGFQKFRDKDCFINMGVTMSYGEVDQLSAQFASYLQHEAKLQPGDRIALQMPNCFQYPIALIGALRAGLVVVNTNPLYTPREMEHQFNDSGAKAIVILANFAYQLDEVKAKTKLETVIVAHMGDLLGFPKGLVTDLVLKYQRKQVPAFSTQHTTFKQALSLGKRKAYQPVALKPTDLAFLQYTGGTTGVSKGAMLTHRNILANMEQIAAWIGPKLVEGQEVIMTPLPLYHVFALTVNCLAFIHYGGKNILVTNPRDLPSLIKELKQYPVTALTGVNTLFNGMLNQQEFEGVDFSKVKVVVGGAMAIQRPVAEHWKRVTHKPLLEGYGLTEASPVVSCNPIDGTERIGTIGLPLPSTEIKLVDDDGKIVKFGESGELCVRGPQVMQGYYNQPEETARVLKDGWLYTGDVAVQEADGFFRIVDRKKDMILVSGFNVYPNEVEDVVARHPKVLEVAVIGIPDDKSGEAVVAHVVKKDASLTEDEVKAHCRSHLTNYKVPRKVVFRESLPKTPVGKVLRRALREG